MATPSLPTLSTTSLVSTTTPAEPPVAPTVPESPMFPQLMSDVEVGSLPSISLTPAFNPVGRPASTRLTSGGKMVPSSSFGSDLPPSGPSNTELFMLDTPAHQPPPDPTRFNPFQGNNNTAGTVWTFDRRRWAHVYMKTAAAVPNTSAPARLEPLGIQDINWASLCEPAVLPITTDFLQTAQLLSVDAKSKPAWTVLLPNSDTARTAPGTPTRHRAVSAATAPASGGTASFSPEKFRWLYEYGSGSGPKLSVTVVEAGARMVGYRLDQNYQLVDMTLASGEQYPWMHNPTGIPLCALALGHRLHVVLYQPDAEQMEVQPFERKKVDVGLSHACTVLVWEPLLQQAVPRPRVFTNATHDFTMTSELNWAAIDQLGCLPDALDTNDPDHMMYNHLVYAVFFVPPAPPSKPLVTEGSGDLSAIDASGATPPPSHVPDTPNGILQFMDALLTRHGAKVCGPGVNVRVSG